MQRGEKVLIVGRAMGGIHTFGGNSVLRVATAVTKVCSRLRSPTAEKLRRQDYHDKVSVADLLNATRTRKESRGSGCVHGMLPIFARQHGMRQTYFDSETVRKAASPLEPRHNPKPIAGRTAPARA